jgi:hypothetical protein
VSIVRPDPLSTLAMHHRALSYQQGVAARGA